MESIPFRGPDHAAATGTWRRSPPGLDFSGAGYKVFANMLNKLEPKQCGGADVARLARIFRALSVDTRVRMMVLLRDRPLCVGALARSLGITAAAVSQHLRVLRDAGAVVADRRGNFVHYRADMDVLAAWGRDMAGFFPGERAREPEEVRLEAARPEDSGGGDRPGTA